jgi:hypothetical protein
MGAKERAADLRRGEGKLGQVSGPAASSSSANVYWPLGDDFAARKTGFRRER